MWIIVLYNWIIPSQLKKPLPSKIEHIYNNIKYNIKMMNEANIQSKNVQQGIYG